jgi:chromosome segregation ATPase
VAVEEIFRLGNRIAVIETDHQHLVRQITAMDQLIREHSAKSDATRDKIQTIQDLINQVRGAYKAAVVFLAIMGVFNGVIMSKIIGWL